MNPYQSFIRTTILCIIRRNQSSLAEIKLKKHFNILKYSCTCNQLEFWSVRFAVFQPPDQHFVNDHPYVYVIIKKFRIRVSILCSANTNSHSKSNEKTSEKYKCANSINDHCGIFPFVFVFGSLVLISHSI